MQDGTCAFFGVDVRATVVRGGQDTHMRGYKDHNDDWRSTHKMQIVYLEMFFQIQMDYSSLPNPLKLKLRDIRTYYEFLGADLRGRTKK